MLTGPVVAVMFHVTWHFFGSETETYVATYRDLETCRSRIVELDKSDNLSRDPNFYRQHRYCRLKAVVQNANKD